MCGAVGLFNGQDNLRGVSRSNVGAGG
jgi:hypothetical protein